MKNIDLTKEFTDFNGKPLGVPNKTLKEILVEVLLFPDPNDKPDKKYRYFSLAKVINETNEITFDAETAELIFEKVERIGLPIIVGRVREELYPCT